MKLSLILPIYNVEDYLERYLNSILSQNNFSKGIEENIEVLLIDDGSPDKSYRIAQKYSHSYSFIKYYKKENGGLSDARNFGVSKSQGEYIWFIDPDDWIAKNALETIFKEITTHDLDLLLFDYYKAKENNRGPISLAQKDFYHQISTSTITGVNFIEKYGYIEGAWDKVIRKDILTKHNINFPKGEVNEDNIFAYQITRFSNRIKKINLFLYYYYSREGSITTNKNLKHIKRHLDDQLKNRERLSLIIEQETIAMDKVKEMQSFFTTNLLFEAFDSFKDKSIIIPYISKLKALNLYPIKPYSYHNDNLKRKVFIQFINQEWLIKLIAKTKL